MIISTNAEKWSAFTISIQLCTKSLNYEYLLVIQTGKEEVKSSLLTDNITVYVKKKSLGPYRVAE